MATALFDCSWDVQKAVELLLEEGGDLGSWEETGKKKKKKQEKDKEDRDDWDDNFEPVNSRQDSDHYRDRSRGGRGGAPRFKRGGGPGLGRQVRRSFLIFITGFPAMLCLKYLNRIILMSSILFILV